MTSPNRRGWEIETLAKKVLLSQGDVVHHTQRSGVHKDGTYYSNVNDVFGCIDLIAKRRGEATTRWIQVMSTGNVGEKIQKLSKVPWNPVTDKVEIWRWVEGTGPTHDQFGRRLPRRYFQVYKFEDGYKYRAASRIYVDG